MARRWLQTRW